MNAQELTEAGVRHAEKSVLYTIAERIGVEAVFDLLLDALQQDSYRAGFLNAGGKLDENGEPIHKVARAAKTK